jgi:hypothetical protein
VKRRSLNKFHLPVLFQVTDKSASPPVVKFTTELSYTASTSSLNMTNVELSDYLGGSMKAFWSNTFIPGLSASGISTVGRTSVHYNLPIDLGKGLVD